jgi:hypothetical protein
MRIVEHDGIVKEVIDAINAAFADGPLSTVRTIILTQDEMDEFVKVSPFEGGVGKYYGDGDVPSLMNVQNRNDGVTVSAFYLQGILVAVAPVGKAD